MEIKRLSSYGGFSVRGIITFVLAVIATALLWTTITPVNASAADASWSNGSIVYDNHEFTSTSTLKDSTDTIPSNSATFQSDTVTSDGKTTISVIYFASGTDPTEATEAYYAEFTYNESTSTLSNVSNKKTITFEEQSDEEKNSGTCSVSGIGWIICPVTTYMANAMDNIFSILSGMIEAQPLTVNDTDNSMYKAWDMSRSFANIIFVIAFLIIIYSQLTSLGVSNYGVKKMIPRLIVAAVLVNASYYIAAIAIDISNVLGYSVQNAFNIARDDLFVMTNDNFGPNVTSGWAKVTSLILAGCGGTYAGLYLQAGGSLYLLVPILVGLLITVLLVLVILAARQAIIIILVILAPLAFVANLLPNTEKWFGKWKDLFATMLIFFPAFSLVFGGSQLAGQVIIENAGDNLVMILFGMAVQVAPLAITPLIMKFSGGLLGKVAQITNDRSKGSLDRSRNWAKKRQEMARNRNMANVAETGPRLRRPGSWGAEMVRRTHNRRKAHDMNADVEEKRAQTQFEATDKYRKINARSKAAELDSQTVKDTNDAEILRQRRQRGTQLYNSGVAATVAKEKLERAQGNLDEHYNAERLIGGTALNRSMESTNAQKLRTQASEKNVEAHLSNRRSVRTSELGMASEMFEAAELNAQGSLDSYNAHMSQLKANPRNTQLYQASIHAQASKDHAEAAQKQLSAMFDKQRSTVGTPLNVAAHTLEQANLDAGTAQSRFKQYIHAQHADVGSDIHTTFIRNSAAKSAEEVAEVQAQNVVEQYKSGKIVRTGELSTYMTEMVDNVSILAAEKRGIQATQNIQQANIADDMKGSTTFSEQLIATASGIDPHGATRARAAAISTLNKIDQENLNNSVVLIRDDAAISGRNAGDIASDYFKKEIGTYKDATGTRLPAEPQDESILEAALDIAASNGDILTIRKAMVDPNFTHKEMLFRVIDRNADTLKAKGGFDIQRNKDKLWNVTQEEMDISAISSLGSVSPLNMDSQNYGWWKSLGDTHDDGSPQDLDRMIDAVINEGRSASTPKQIADYNMHMNQISALYNNLTNALSSDDIMSRIGDRREETIKMHEVIHSRPEFQNIKNEVDYEIVRRAVADKRDRT